MAKFLTTTDHRYISLGTQNESEALILASLNYERPQGILQNPSEYRLFLERFSLPARTVPLFSFVDNAWSVTLGRGGNFYRAFLAYVPGDLAPPARFPAPSQPVFEIAPFVQSINDALVAATAALNVGEGLALDSPWMLFDEGSQQFSLLVPSNGYLLSWTAAGGADVEIFFNGPLAGRLPALSYQFNYDGVAWRPDGDDARLVATRTGDNLIETSDPGAAANGRYLEGFGAGAPLSGTYYEIRQEGPQVDALLDFNRILVLSVNLPTREEFVGSVFDGADASYRIVTDFVIDSSQTASQRHSLVYNNPTGATRPLDLVSDSPMGRIDLEVYFASKSGRVFPLLLGPGQGMDFKLLFQRIGADYSTELPPPWTVPAL